MVLQVSAEVCVDILPDLFLQKGGSKCQAKKMVSGHVRVHPLRGTYLNQSINTAEKENG